MPDIRLNRLHEELEHRRLQALWVTGPENCRYLLGRSGHEPLDISLLALPGHTIVLCSPLYLEALSDLPLEIVPWRSGLLETLLEILQKRGIGELHIESQQLKHSTVERLQGLHPGLTLSAAGQIVEQFRLLKSAEEIETISQACRITDQAYQEVLTLIRAGMTEREVAWLLERSMREQGAEDVSFRPLVVAFGSASAEPHHVPSDRPLRRGELIQLDIGARFQNYGADLSRVAVLGPPAEEVRVVYQLVREVQAAAIGRIHPGSDGAEIDRECKEIIAHAGYPPYSHGLGHGIGLAESVHEAPFLSARSVQPVKLREDMVVTVEPGIYLAGRFGVRIEDIVRVTSEGTECLSQAPLDLAIL